jgi:hypothetical protein
MVVEEFPFHPHPQELQSLLMLLGLSQVFLLSTATEQLLLPQVRLMIIKYKIL